jgi:hypothetical protein
LARELFYQLALIRFSGAPVAVLDKGGVDVKALIEYALQFEEDCAGTADKLENEIKISDTNRDLATQATNCLADNGEIN